MTNPESDQPIGSSPPLREPSKVTVWCPECNEAVVVTDVHAFLLGLHQRVCGELANVNGES